MALLAEAVLPSYAATTELQWWGNVAASLCCSVDTESTTLSWLETLFARRLLSAGAGKHKKASDHVNDA
ncbi:hypothetical protein MUK42_17988 [Musa troglodytarum]|uniref:Uncharacterized protein n=1 Tax=Musa troglodytarum TaxID=320322 RepID=A0A9E7EU36_9LILI|nr:hypothetical protein MUK42_17988 [Musa troglodytarum]